MIESTSQNVSSLSRPGVGLPSRCKTKTVLVTGGTGKLGSVFVHSMAKLGHQVIFTSTSKDRINTFLDTAPKDYELIGIEMDLEEEHFAQQLVDELEEKGVFPNVVIHNARSLDYFKVDLPHGTSR